VNARSDLKQQIAETMAALNQSWLEGRLDDLKQFFHPDIAMALPGFSGTEVGADAVLAGFEDMVRTATVDSFETGEPHIHIVGSSAVVSYPFDIEYARDEKRYKSTGSDLWVFSFVNGSWKAIWRIMLDLHDELIAE
jgi:hypothetical protein